MSKSNHVVQQKVQAQLEKYAEDVREVLTKGLEYTLRNNSMFVANHLRRDIDRIVKGRKK